MSDFKLEIEYIDGCDFVYIRATCHTMAVCYYAKTPEDIAKAVKRYIEEEF